MNCSWSRVTNDGLVVYEDIKRTVLDMERDSEASPALLENKYYDPHTKYARKVWSTMVTTVNIHVRYEKKYFRYVAHICDLSQP